MKQMYIIPDLEFDERNHAHANGISYQYFDRDDKYYYGACGRFVDYPNLGPFDTIEEAKGAANKFNISRLEPSLKRVKDENE